KPVFHLLAGGWGSVDFDVFFGCILWELLFFEQYLVMNGIAFSNRSKISPHRTSRQHPFFSIDLKSPWIILVHGIAPGAVLPDDIHLIKFKNRRLCVRNVGNAVFL